MRTEFAYLNESERGAFSILIAFLRDRLATAETVNWALRLGPAESVKRAAVLQLIDGPEGRRLNEPWRTAWRMIEEYWDRPDPDQLSDIRPYDLHARLKSGDRSGSLIAAIADCVSPSLRLTPLSEWEVQNRRPPKQPHTAAQLMKMRLVSGELVDPHVMGLDEVEDLPFLHELANTLESEVTRGLDTARRFGWDGERKLYRLGELNRVYFVPVNERRPGEREPDEFNDGIAPSVKLLHFVVNRLLSFRSPEASKIAERWKLTASPVYVRLWAALARDPWVASAGEVSIFLKALDNHRFWDVQNFPEIAELRARRFREFEFLEQQAIATRLRKLPPRNEWPRGTAPDRLARARLYWSVREARRIEIGGGTLPTKDEAWFKSELTQFPELVQMSRLDDGFLGTAEARSVPPNPDSRYIDLVGDDRLSALEVALATARRGWEGDAASRAADWIRQASNSVALISDFEASGNSGANFPKVWERFGWAHSPAPAASDTGPRETLMEEATRVLILLDNLPGGTLHDAIEGISQWMFSWQSNVVKLPQGLTVWRRLWPIAVEVTNAAQPPDAGSDLNIVARASDAREPMDLDTLNLPTGKLLDVFLVACPNVRRGDNPFGGDGTAHTMRDTVIAATGRSGLIVRHRLIEQLQYFLTADAAWTDEHLIRVLLDDSDCALTLWRALARKTQYREVVAVIGPAMLLRATDRRLGRETRRSLVFSLIVECLHALNEKRIPAVSYVDVQQMIRALDDEVRAYAAGTVQQFIREMAVENGPTPEDLFHRVATSFLRDVWPQERSLSTPGVSKALADLPATSGAAFSPAVDAIERFLVPFDAWSMLEYGLFGEDAGVPRISKIDDAEKAAAFLRLLGCTIGTAETAVIPYDLADALAQIEKVAPGLVQQPTYRRLATAARR
jgi:hypothetical protein